MKHPEDDLAIAVADFLRVAAPDLLWWHTPNGGNRGLNEGKRFKAMGVRKGVWDLVFVLPTEGLPTFGFIELKANKNTLTKDQRWFRDDFMETIPPSFRTLVNEDGIFATCRSVQDVQCALSGWGVKMRGSVAA